ncbi:MAG TPA: non-canonical purine NTP pyrophosphatase [Dehalococcoidia bacterium]|jgi:inosine/xanthosine triphosphate pyrophosphatase family protein|nr:non-canonical purine NTP pyrophosphatase [Dehalococcoidia bacterium]HIL31017.1 non-canonical purine NTP pyrophosphatase [Dehalococcoidia bacterium]
MNTPSVTPILLATGNSDKQQAFRSLLSGLSFSPVTPASLGVSASTLEDGDTHEAIAIEKAVAWSGAASMLAIASDGGLIIPSLGPSWQSRHTRRFAGPGMSDSQRVDGLLELMQPFTGADRNASWAEAVAIAYKGRLLASWELLGATGELAKTKPTGLIPEFWVFTIWNFPQLGKTYNELTPEELLSLNDHWSQFGRLVRRFFESIYVPPLD